MFYSFLADIVLVLHIGFVLFVLFGALLIVKWPQAMWLHLPAVFWGAIIEYSGWVCPLTPLENMLRDRAGQIGYRSDFIAHYLLPVLYPSGLTHEIQLVLGTTVLLLNIGLYGWLWRRSRQH